MLRDVIVPKVNSFGLGNCNSLGNGVFQKLAGIGIAHYRSRRLAQHAAHPTERGEQREFCPHFFAYIGRKPSVDAGCLASIQESFTSHADAPVVLAEDKARDRTGM